MSTAQRPDPRSHYDNVTEAWQYLIGDDFHYGYFARPDVPLEAATEALTRLLAESAELQPGAKVLDVGCGTGNPAVYLAGQRGCEVLGISTSKVGVARATKRAAEANLAGRARFEVRDGMATGLEDGSFDCVWVQESSHLMPRKDALLRECARLLRPGGRLALSDIILLREVPLQEMYVIQDDLVVLDKVFGKAAMRGLPEYVRLAEQAGLRVVTTCDVSCQTQPTVGCWRANADRRGSDAANLIGPEAVAEFRAACDILASFWLDRLGYGLLVAERPR